MCNRLPSERFLLHFFDVGLSPNTRIGMDTISDMLNSSAIHDLRTTVHSNITTGHGVARQELVYCVDVLRHRRIPTSAGSPTNKSVVKHRYGWVHSFVLYSHCVKWD